VQSGKPESTRRLRPPLHERVFYAGVGILAAGLIGAGAIYVLTSDDSSRSAPIEFANPRAYEFQIERLGGKAAVYAVRFNEWFSGLWHGRDLAFTIAVLSIVIALVCFWVAHRLARTVESDQDSDGAR
jgi:hypothetical protein